MLLALVLIGCGHDVVVHETSPSDCADDSPEAGEVRTVATGFAYEGIDGTEGLVFSPDGRLFIGGSNRAGGGWVGEVASDGSWELLTPLDGTVGLAWWNDALVVASTDSGLGDRQGGVLVIDPDTGTPSNLATGIDGANFPLVTPWDTLLVSGPQGTTIHEVSAAGAVTPWAVGVPSPNGMVFDAAQQWLYVAQTYQDPSVFRRLAVQGESAGALEEIATLDDGSTQDGVAIDSNGDLYVALNLPGEIIRITPAGEVTLVAQGVFWAASLAFGVGEAWDPCSLYVTSLFDDGLYRVGTGVPGPSEDR